MDKASLRRLKNLYPRFAEVLVEVDRYHPIRVLETYRGEVRQNSLHKSGQSKLRFPMSKHNRMPSMAADVIPLPLPKQWGKQWVHLARFYETSAIIMYEASKKGLILRSGKDWKMIGSDYSGNSFNDLPHLEVHSDNGIPVKNLINVNFSKKISI